MVQKNCSRCGRAAIVSGGCGCSESRVEIFSPERSSCGEPSQRCGGGLLKTAACGLTSTIFRIVNGIDRLLSCGGRR